VTKLLFCTQLPAVSQLLEVASIADWCKAATPFYARIHEQGHEDTSPSGIVKSYWLLSAIAWLPTVLQPNAKCTAAYMYAV
jgi:hypothetical protein